MGRRILGRFVKGIDDEAGSRHIGITDTEINGFHAPGLHVALDSGDFAEGIRGNSL
jgi:hypothetical protein